MKRLLLFLSFCFFLYSAWTVIDKLAVNEIDPVKETIDAGVALIKDIFENANEENPDDEPEVENEIVKLKLEPPSEQVFAIDTIKLGDSKNLIEQKLGSPKRSSMNEYGTEWNAYHENYQNFIMISYNKKKMVSGLYTNQNLIQSTIGIQIGSPKSAVRDQLGDPLTKILKGNTYYQFQKTRDYDMYELDDSYVTIFYDQHQGNTVTAMQIISKELEEDRVDFYTLSSEELKEGFEFQLFDVTNATRSKHGLSILTWDDYVKETARKHSMDMAENDYFNHTNLDGQSPFDRMLEDGIHFTSAGENLAYGQYSGIFAHEGLMNSLGHRENILNQDFQYLGIGVAFNDESHPYYTQNFYSK